MKEKPLIQMNLKDAIKKGKDANGKAIHIPVVSNLRFINGELVCEVEEYVESHLIPISNSIKH